MTKAMWAVVLGVMVWPMGVMGETAKYLDTSLGVEERVRDLISRLSIEEKAQLLDHRAPDLERLNIKSDKWNQCLHGVVWDRPTTMFPVSIAMAATWDAPLVHEEATAISDEARGIYNLWHAEPGVRAQHKGLIYRAPVINISRNPYWGRIEECYGEDPYLTGRIGVAYVTGLQGDDPKYLKLVSTLKHYAVNNVEKDRQSLNAVVDERMLHEYWLPHFRDCIVEGKAQSVMASYNAINGVPNNMNALMLTEILRKRWGFEGFVVSDLGGVGTMVKGHEKGKMRVEDAVAKSINAGCDFSDDEFMKAIPAAVKEGTLPEARVDEAVYRVMRDRFRLGEFDPAERMPFSKISPEVIGSAAHRALALRAARESVVLLSNGKGLLPLEKGKLKTIAVIGPHADRFTAGGYSGMAKEPVTGLQGIKNRAGEGMEVLYAMGGEIVAGKGAFDRAAELKKAVEVAKKAEVAIVFVGTIGEIEREGNDRTSLALPGNQEELVEAVVGANARTVVVLMNAGPLCVPWIKENAGAVVEGWWGGEEGGNAVADVLFGNVNPAARLPYTVYASERQVPAQDEYDVTKGFTYMYLNGEPLYAFGHGLSYTNFEYGKMTLSAGKMEATGKVRVSVEVKNVGKREGEEVVQLYVHQRVSAVKRPAKELRGFERVRLGAGETKTVTFELAGEKLAFYDVGVHGFVTAPGVFDVMVGGASDEIRQTEAIEVIGK